MKIILAPDKFKNSLTGLEFCDAVEDGGGVLSEGYYGSVAADGTVSYLDADGNPSTTKVANGTYIDAESWGGWHYDGPAEQNIFDA